MGCLMFADLSGKSALVTGASGGLGLHFARLLARHGADVTLAARRQSALDQARHEIATAGGASQSIQLDVADAASIEAALDGRHFDILINNAGVSGAGPAADLSEADWDAVLDTNLKGVFLCRPGRRASGMQDEAGRGGAHHQHRLHPRPPRRRRRRPPMPPRRPACDPVSPRRSRSSGRADGIRVNALCPGYIETDINRDFFATEAGLNLIKRIPQRRLGQAEELDGALLLLASSAGSYITGATIEVDGGHLVSSL
jgi:NAD(P)-dependent dehydrogenase (short-subunit alcohol dehydrogenase family)